VCVYVKAKEIRDERKIRFEKEKGINMLNRKER